MSASVLYIHGFASCGTGNKVEVLKHHYGADRVASPDLPVAPEQAIACLQDLLQCHEFRLLVGSSLGGYYADHLNARFRIPAVLINPSTQPFDTLRNYVGRNTNWCSQQVFEWKAQYLDQLKGMYRKSTMDSEDYLVLLQTGDEVLDYRLAELRYARHQVIIEQGGNHRFENLTDYLPVIDEYLARVEMPDK